MQVDNNFINTYTNYIYSSIRKTGVQKQETLEDIYSLVIERIIDTSKDYDPERGEVTAWLGYQVKSVVSNYFKKKLRSKDLYDKNTPMSLVDEYQKETALKVIVNARKKDEGEARLKAYSAIWDSKLLLRDKKILNAKILKGMTNSEIAEVLGIRPASVGRKVRRAIKKLREYYDKIGTDSKD